MRRLWAALLLVLSVALSAPALSAPAPSTPVAAVAGDHARSAQGARLSIPALGVDAGMIDVGVRKGQLAIGRSVRDVYRWRQGVRPGQRGSAVLAGHTWSKGDGVFDRLGELRPGDRVTVGKAKFKVTRVRRVTHLNAAGVRDLFSDRGRARLVLITCGDRNNVTGVYRTRIIVNAKKIRRNPRPAAG